MESCHPVEMPHHAGLFLDLAESVNHWSVGFVRNPDETELLKISGSLLERLRTINASIRRMEQEAGVIVEDIELLEEPSLMERFNHMLLLVASARTSMVQLRGSFVEKLSQVEPTMANDLESELYEAITASEQFEQLLVLMGAGTDEDVSRIMHLVPTSEDLGFVT